MLKYRPAKNQRIDSKVVSRLTPLFGTIAGILFLAALIVAGGHKWANLITGLECLAYGWIAFFILYRITFAVAWNSRVKPFKKSKRTEQNSPQ